MRLEVNAVILMVTRTAVLILTSKETAVFFVNCTGSPRHGLPRSLDSSLGTSEDPQVNTEAMARTAFPSPLLLHPCFVNFIGSNAQAGYLQRDSAMDDFIGGPEGVTGLRVH